MIASKLVNILFQNILLYTKIIIIGSILITTDDAFSIKQIVLK